MSGKFMKIKKVIVPTITMVIIASQLMGCAAASQSELLQMINNGEAIEIEVATQAFAEAEQGTESSILWEQLALLNTNDVLRKAWDNTLGIINTEKGKNGILYVNTKGENEPNNTLRVALHNREFVKFLENESSMNELSEAVANQYIDINVEDTGKAVYMGINGYFNLLPDNQVNYANADSTLQRNEFMAMLFRAETQVQDLTEDSTFSRAVGKSDLNIYAQGVLEDSYLDIESNSLDNMTYNGTITRAEAVYTLVSRYFSDDFAKVDIKDGKFMDTKDGGSIAVEQKFIQDGVAKEHWKSYELTYALQNPDNGLPTDLYKALIVAADKGLIDSYESRWDEALTRAEAVELLVKVYQVENGIAAFNAKQGIVEGYEAPVEEVNTEEDVSVDSTGTDVTFEEDEYTEANNTEATTSKGKTSEEELNKQLRQETEELYKIGAITHEEYEAALEYLEKEPQLPKPTDNGGNVDNGEGAASITPDYIPEAPDLVDDGSGVGVVVH